MSIALWQYPVTSLQGENQVRHATHSRYLESYTLEHRLKHAVMAFFICIENTEGSASPHAICASTDSVVDA